MVQYITLSKNLHSQGNGCEELLIGYFEMEDCVVYLPGHSPFNCTGNDLEIIPDLTANKLTLRSSVYQFCDRPLKIYTCGKSLAWPENCKTPAYACQATILEKNLSLDEQQLELTFDQNFFDCAFESDSEGFWFALPIK